MSAIRTRRFSSMTKPEKPWKERREEADRERAMSASQIIQAEFDRGKGKDRLGARVFRERMERTDLDYEPDPTGRHRMKFPYYVAYRLIRLLLRAWSRPALCLDTRFWIKADPFGNGLGVSIGLRLMRLEASALSLLEDTYKGLHVDCDHSPADKEAALRVRCPLCLERSLRRQWGFTAYLERRNDETIRALMAARDELTRMRGGRPD